MQPPLQSVDSLALSIKEWGRELGFQKVGIAGVELADDEQRLAAWLAQGRHGTMHYMERHGTRRSRPAELIPGTIRVVSARMDYRTDTADPDTVLNDPLLGYVSRYALGRDYHKVLRHRLAQLAERIALAAGTAGYRAFTDSAPVLEKALARDAGLGWIGKHTNLLDRHDGSWFFLGEVYTDLPLPIDAPVSSHCGSCTACIDVCPTQAIVAPYELDARRCISYLTIEHDGSDPGRVPRGARQSHLRLRRLPARVPVESLCEGHGRAGFSCPARARRTKPRRAVSLERRTVPGANRRQRDPAHRLRTVVAECRRGTGERAGDAGGHRRTRITQGGRERGRAGARALGAGK